MENNENILYIDFLRTLRVLLSKFWIVILSCLICGGAMFAYARLYISPTYKSDVLFYVNSSSVNIGGSSISVDRLDLSTSKSLVSTYIVILKTRNTLEAVISKNNLNYTYEQLNSMISASAVNGTEIFSVTVTSNSAEEACKIANAIAKVFPDKITEIVTGTGARIVDYAVVNNSPIGPNVKKYVAIGAVFGFIVSCVAIVLFDIFDDTIKGESDLIDSYSDIPVLAVIPDLESSSKTGYYSSYEFEDDKKKGKKTSSGNGTLLCDAMHFDAKEAYKLLRTNVNFCLPDNKCRKIGVTSAIRGEGKSTVAINLAYALAQTGAKVLLIDMDMRLPSIAKKLGFEQGLGLSDILVNETNLADCIKSSTKHKNWHILSSGSIPPVPSELLGSQRMKAVMEALESQYNYIVCDLPPVNLVSDASVVKEILDGFIMIIKQGYSDKHSLGDCMRQLSFIEANTLGFVLNNGTTNNAYSKKYSKYYKKNKKYYYRESYNNQKKEK